MRTRVRRLGVFSMLFLAHLGVQSCSSSSEGDEDVAATEEGNAAEGGENAEANPDMQANSETPAEGSQNVAENAPTGDDTAAAPMEGDATADGAADGNAALQNIVTDMNAGGQQAAAPVAEGEEGAEEAAPMANANATASANTAAPMPSASTAATGGPAGGALPEFGSKMPYIVQPGDTLAKISAKIYGDMGQWKQIATLSNLQRPNKIYPGDVVYYQLTQASQKYAQAYETVARQEITAQKGDTLATIAKRALGSSVHWKAIWRQNDQIDNPDVINPGQSVYYINPQQLASALDSFRHSTIATSKKITDKVLGLQSHTQKTKTVSAKKLLVKNNVKQAQQSEINVQLVVSGISAMI